MGMQLLILELQETLLNEQGKGAGPYPEWWFEPSQQAWMYVEGRTRRMAEVTRRDPIGGWDWRLWSEGVLVREDRSATARGAMRLAMEAMP